MASSFVIKRLIFYGIFSLLCVIAISFVLWTTYEWVLQKRHLGSAQISFKAQYLKENIDQFNMVFLGDSRTFCAIQPDLMDVRLQTKSFNMAHWSNWFPTQYAYLNDALNYLPEGMTVVWSIGHQNFRKSKINEVYPIQWSEMPYLISQGFELSEMVQARLSFDPLFAVIGRRQTIYDKVQNILKRPFYASRTQSKQAHSKKASIKASHDLTKWTQGPLIGYINPWYDDQGNLASVAQYKTNGAYLRTELIPKYYREQQHNRTSARTTIPAFVPFEGSWNLYVKMLDMMKAKKLHVIINIFEEAPHTYASTKQKEVYRYFMTGPVKDEALKRGFRFINVGFDQIGDENYFDYNHLNSKGVSTFTGLFVEQMKIGME